MESGRLELVGFLFILKEPLSPCPMERETLAIGNPCLRQYTVSDVGQFVSHLCMLL